VESCLKQLRKDYFKVRNHRSIFGGGQPKNTNYSYSSNIDVVATNSALNIDVVATNSAE
jgi:hypothetical protein